MANDADWVGDVRRWVFSAASSATANAADAGEEPIAMGYEAAHPALQAKHWPDTPTPTAQGLRS